MSTSRTRSGGVHRCERIAPATALLLLAGGTVLISPCVPGSPELLELVLGDDVNNRARLRRFVTAAQIDRIKTEPKTTSVDGRPESAARLRGSIRSAITLHHQNDPETQKLNPWDSDIERHSTPHRA